MAVHGPDYTAHTDGPKREIRYQEEHPIPAERWTAERAAAATSLAAWLSYLQTADAPGYSWLSAKPGSVQEGLRAALLSLAP